MVQSIVGQLFSEPCHPSPSSLSMVGSYLGQILSYFHITQQSQIKQERFILAESLQRFQSLIGWFQSRKVQHRRHCTARDIVAGSRETVNEVRGSSTCPDHTSSDPLPPARLYFTVSHLSINLSVDTSTEDNTTHDSVISPNPHL